MQTKTTTKPAKPSKAKPETAAKPSALVAYIVATITAKLAEKGETFYNTALTYHAKRKTVFPRSDAHKTVTREMAENVFDRHAKRILSSGSADGQAVFDLYMMHKPK